jgi:hypothetical protein
VHCLCSLVTCADEVIGRHKVTVSAPDLRGRRQILDVHARGVPLADDVDLDTVAAATPGMVGADPDRRERPGPAGDAAFAGGCRRRPTAIDDPRAAAAMAAGHCSACCTCWRSTPTWTPTASSTSWLPVCCECSASHPRRRGRSPPSHYPLYRRLDLLSPYPGTFDPVNDGWRRQRWNVAVLARKTTG